MQTAVLDLKVQERTPPASKRLKQSIQAIKSRHLNLNLKIPLTYDQNGGRLLSEWKFIGEYSFVLHASPMQNLEGRPLTFQQTHKHVK
jgi:hypothetical protein